MKPLLLIKGNNVRIRSREWFDYNKFNSSVGRFIPSMSSYCDSNAIVNGNLCKPLFDDFSYKLNIDGGKYDWQDFMFEPESIVYNYVRIRNYCIDICSLSCSDTKSEDDLCPIRNLIELFRIGDKVKIRSSEWLEFNGGFIFFTFPMFKYCGKEATIVNVSSKCGINLYTLDIDDGEHYWQNFMFEVPSPSSPLLEKIYNDLCEFGCLRDCKSNKCLLFKYKKSV